MATVDPTRRRTVKNTHGHWPCSLPLSVFSPHPTRHAHTREIASRQRITLAQCNIPSFKNPEKSEKFITFSNYMYFTLKRNFMHCMHHHLVLFAFVCSEDWNIIFQFKIYLTKLYVWVYIIPNKIFWCLPSLSYALFELFDFACLKLICDCFFNYFIIGL